MAKINHQALIEDLHLVFNLLEDLADEEAKKLAFYINIRGLKEEDEPFIAKSDKKIELLRSHAEKVQRVLDLLIDEE